MSLVLLKQILSVTLCIFCLSFHQLAWSQQNSVVKGPSSSTSHAEKATSRPWHELDKAQLKAVIDKRLSQGPNDFKELTHPENPFWRKKDAVYYKIVEKRAIIVSAKIPEEKGMYRMIVQGAGHVSAPISYTFKETRRFEKLPEITSVFQEVRYNPKTRRLYVHGAAAGIHARMLMQLKFKEEDKHGVREIFWENIGGEFKGMKGVIHYRRYSRMKTEMSIYLEYRSKKIPLPKVLMGFGLELVVEKAAQLLRSYLEEGFKERLQMGAGK